MKKIALAALGLVVLALAAAGVHHIELLDIVRHLHGA